MKITLNNKSHEIEQNASLLQFIESLNISDDGMAVAINNTVVPKSKWSSTILEENAELIIIQAVSGG